MNNIKLLEQAVDILNYTEGYTNDDNEKLVEVMDILEDIRSNLVEDSTIEDLLASLPYLDYSEDNALTNIKVTDDKNKYTPYLTKYGDDWYLNWMNERYDVLASFNGRTAREVIENALRSLKPLMPKETNE